jgi:hypothetical protein
VELLLPLKLARYGVPLPELATASNDALVALLPVMEKVDGDTAELEPVKALVPSESTDLVDPGETDTVAPTLGGNFPPSVETELSALEVAARARLERLRAVREQAAASWWAAQREPDPPTFNEHAKASGISVPTLRKSIAEFPPPETEVVA